MKSIILLTMLTLASANRIVTDEPFSSYGYNSRVSIPLGRKIREAEEAYLNQDEMGRIAGGEPSNLGQFPYQAGVLTNYTDIEGIGVCGGSLITPNRIVHAAHCWRDGRHTPHVSEVVLGSTTYYYGGIYRIVTDDVVVHPEWNHVLTRNDIGMIKLPMSVDYSENVAPIALPSGSQLEEDFVGERAVASGYGRKGDGPYYALSWDQYLSHVELTVISNSECRQHSLYSSSVLDTNICVSGADGHSTCKGDSGGPLAITRDDKPLLIGITSYGDPDGCQLGYPVVFTRVTSFIDFIEENQ